MELNHLIFYILCIIVFAIAIYEINKHYCCEHLTKKMKSCTLKDGYYNMEFEVSCKVCDKIHKLENIKFKKIIK